MSAALVTTGLLLGLAGGPHCAAMCGALQAAAARRAGGVPLRALAALHLGRLLGYSAAGAVVAASVAAIASLGTASAVLRPVWTMFHVGALVLGLVLLWTGRIPAFLAAWGRRPVPAAAGVNPAMPIRVLRGLAPTVRAAGIGACWAAMPCGLLQSALIVAALASNAGQGALVMAAFCLGTLLSLGLVMAAWSGRRWARGPLAETTLPVRLAGGMLAGASAYAVVHGLWPGVDQVLCL